jgi:signal transduction protein with GAF and PtsI domain
MMTDLDATYFNSFRDVVRTIHSTLDVKKVLEAMVTNTTVVMNLKACAVRLLNPKLRTLELAATFGLSDAYLKKGPVDADQSIADAMTGKTVVVEDAAADPRTQYQEQAKQEGIASIVSIPLSIKGRVIGVMRLYSSEPRNFLPRELDFAEALGEIGALAIENARMHEQLKQDYEEVVNDIHSFVGYRRSI